MNITKRMALAAFLILFSAVTAGASNDWIYAVKPGDTLMGVAGAYLKNSSDWDKLQRLNHVADPTRLVPGTTLRIPLAWLKQVDAMAEIVWMQGDVRKITKDALKPIFSGGKLTPGDTVKTGAGSNLTLRFADGSRLLVSQNSRFTLSRLRYNDKTGTGQTNVVLNEGSVSTQVAPQKGPAASYEIESQALNLGVRGTDFRVGVAADGMTHSEVLKGRVIAAGSGASVALPGGYGTFAAPGQPPAAPILLPQGPDLGGLPDSLEHLPLQFSWPGQPGVAQYRAEVFADASFATLLLEGVFQEPGASWPDLPDGKYVLRVRGIIGNGLEGLNADREFTLRAHMQPPHIVEPLDGMTEIGNKTRFLWAKPANSRDFRLQVAATQDFTPLLFDVPHACNAEDVPRLGVTEHVLALPPGQYYWRIAAVAPNGDLGTFSRAQGFVQRAVVENPAATSSTGGDQLSFRWKAGEAGQKYQLQMARDGDFRNLVFDTQVADVQFNVARPKGGIYYVRIKTIGSDGGAGTGAFGETQRIEVSDAFPGWVLFLLAR